MRRRIIPNWSKMDKVDPVDVFKPCPVDNSSLSKSIASLGSIYFIRFARCPFDIKRRFSVRSDFSFPSAFDVTWVSVSWPWHTTKRKDCPNGTLKLIRVNLFPHGEEKRIWRQSRVWLFVSSSLNSIGHQRSSASSIVRSSGVIWSLKYLEVISRRSFRPISKTFSRFAISSKRFVLSVSSAWHWVSPRFSICSFRLPRRFTTGSWWLCAFCKDWSK